jgi:hypothetical protein
MLKQKYLAVAQQKEKGNNRKKKNQDLKRKGPAKSLMI